MAKWRTDGVKVVRAATLDMAMRGPGGTGRATVFDFLGNADSQGKTWVGTVTNPPSHNTGPHNHGRHEAALYVVHGRGQIRWGEHLEFAAEISAGDFAYFPPFVPHQELNLSPTDRFDFVVVRSDNAKITNALEIAPVSEPETVY